jgi:hypothetical protein
VSVSVVRDVSELLDDGFSVEEDPSELLEGKTGV